MPQRKPARALPDGTGGDPQTTYDRQERCETQACLLATRQRHGQGHYHPQSPEAWQEITQNPKAPRNPQGLGAAKQEPGAEVAEPAGHQPVHDPRSLAREPPRVDYFLFLRSLSGRGAGAPAASGEELQRGVGASGTVGRVGGGCAVHELQEAWRQLLWLVGQQRAGGGADGVDVRELRRIFSIQDLRGDVAWGADGIAYLRQARVPGPIGNSEVGQLRPPAAVHEDVLGFYVPVYHTLRVGVREGFEDLDQNLYDLVEGVVSGGDIERYPMHELGHQVYLQVTRDDLEGLDDVRVPQALRDLALPQGPRTLFGTIDRDDLDGHLPGASAEPSEETFPGAVCEAGSPHGREAALSDHLRERVATLAGSPAADVVRLLGHLLLFYSATRPFCYEYSQKACKRDFVGK